MVKFVMVEFKDGWEGEVVVTDAEDGTVQSFHGDWNGKRKTSRHEALGIVLERWREELGIELVNVRLCKQCGNHKPCECPLFDLSYLEPVWHPE